jgi:alkanesulfonate monooxygenase SsuD/methylene tetrahydromethanopterin reductase-like flavin-dependent oxidoreductase (luciferase family)
MANAARALSDAYPERFLLGLGASNEISVPARGHDFSRPLSRMRSYLDELDEAPYLAPEPAAPSAGSWPRSDRRCWPSPRSEASERIRTSCRSSTPGSRARCSARSPFARLRNRLS